MDIISTNVALSPLSIACLRPRQGKGGVEVGQQKAGPEHVALSHSDGAEEGEEALHIHVEALVELLADVYTSCLAIPSFSRPPQHTNGH
jgi:hypothetical protein